MFVSAVLLIVSVLAIAVMVLFRVWELRAGRLAVDENVVPEDFFSLSAIEKSAEAFIRKAQVISYHLLVFALSHLLVFFRRTGDSVGKEWKKLSVHLPKHLPQLPHHTNSAGSSFFLKDISARKEEVRKENGYHE